MLSLDSQFGDPWYKISNRWSDLFHGVPDRKDWPFFSPPEDLPFGGPIDPKDDLLFVVESDAPYRWRMRVYDTYTGSGWTNGGPRSKVAAEEVPLEEYVEPFRDREQVEIGVRIYSKANALVTVGEPVKARIPATVELSPQPDFRLYLLGSQVSYLPPEVEEHRGALIDWLIDGHPPPDPDSPLSDLEETQPEPVPEKLLDLGFALAPPSDGATDPYLSVHRLEPTTEPPVALLSQRILVPYYKYHTVGSLSHAKPFPLRTAGQDYPDWVSDRYLQLPNDFPRTVPAPGRRPDQGPRQSLRHGGGHPPPSDHPALQPGCEDTAAGEGLGGVLPAGGAERILPELRLGHDNDVAVPGHTGPAGRRVRPRYPRPRGGRVDRPGEALPRMAGGPSSRGTDGSSSSRLRPTFRMPCGRWESCRWEAWRRTTWRMWILARKKYSSKDASILMGPSRSPTTFLTKR